jgi:hypothetical protein
MLNGLRILGLAGLLVVVGGCFFAYLASLESAYLWPFRFGYAMTSIVSLGGIAALLSQTPKQLA